MQSVRVMRAILHMVTAPPLGHRGLGDAVAVGQDGVGHDRGAAWISARTFGVVLALAWMVATIGPILPLHRKETRRLALGPRITVPGFEGYDHMGPDT